MLTTASSRRNKSSSASTAKVAGKKESSTMSATDVGFAKRKHRIRGLKSMLHRRLQLTSVTSLVVVALIIIAVGMFKHLSFQVSSLRGGDEERNIWVSQNSQPFVSPWGFLSPSLVKPDELPLFSWPLEHFEAATHATFFVISLRNIQNTSTNY